MISTVQNLKLWYINLNVGRLNTTSNTGVKKEQHTAQTLN